MKFFFENVRDRSDDKIYDLDRRVDYAKPFNNIGKSDFEEFFV